MVQFFWPTLYMYIWPGQTPTAALPLDPAEGLPSQTPSAQPTSKSILRHCTKYCRGQLSLRFVLHVDVQEMIGQDYGTTLVTPSSRRRTSAFGIDELLGLSRRDVLVTSLTPPRQSVTVSSAEDRHRSPAVDRATVPCCCPVDVEDWTDTSSDMFRAPFGSSTTPMNHSADIDVSRSDQQHRTGRTLSHICI